MNFKTLEANAFFSLALDVEIKVEKMEQLFQRNELSNEDYIESKKIMFDLIAEAKEKINNIKIERKEKNNE